MFGWMVLAALTFGCGGDVASEGDGEKTEQLKKIEEIKNRKESEDALSMKVKMGEISVLSKKNGDVPVAGRFGSVRGSLSFADASVREQLTGEVVVGLASWNSELVARDTNMKDVFFKISEKGRGVFTVSSVAGIPEGGIPVGGEVEVVAKGTLELLSNTTEHETKLRIRRSNTDDYFIDSAEPLKLSIEGLGLGENLSKLKEVCGHESVDDTVELWLRLTVGVARSESRSKSLGSRQMRSGGPSGGSGEMGSGPSGRMGGGGPGGKSGGPGGKSGGPGGKMGGAGFGPRRGGLGGGGKMGKSKAGGSASEAAENEPETTQESGEQ